MIPIYSRVRLATDRFVSQGAKQGDIGYVIEVYGGGAYEVDFSHPDGTTYASFAAYDADLELYEPTEAIAPDPAREE